MHTPSPHLRRDRAPATSAPGPGSPCHIRTGTGLTPATFTPGPGSHLARALACWLAHATPCAVTGPAQHGPTWPEHVRLVLAAQQAQQLCAAAEAAACRADREPPGTGLDPVATSAPGPGSPRRHIGIGIRTWRLLAPFAPGLGSLHPHLRRDWAHCFHICTGTGLIPATSSRGLGSSPALPVR